MGRTVRETALTLRGFPVVVMDYEDGRWNLHVMGPAFLRHEVEPDQTLDQHGHKAFPYRSQIVRIYSDGRRTQTSGIIEQHHVAALLAWWDAHPEPWSAEVSAWREPDGRAMGRAGIGYVAGTFPEAFWLTEEEAERVLALIQEETRARDTGPQSEW